MNNVLPGIVLPNFLNKTIMGLPFTYPNGYAHETTITNETIMSKRLQTAMNIAHDSFITDKKQIIY